MDWSKLNFTTHSTVRTLKEFLESIGEHTEAELRLGNSEFSLKKGSCFNPKLDVAQYKQLYNRLKLYKDWETSSYHKRLVDYFYLYNGKPLRTTVTTEGNQLKIVHQEKTQGSHLLIPLNNLEIRISLKDELVVNDVPKYTDTTCVRIKDRHSFVKHNWCYDFTVVRQAKTEALAEQAEPFYEIEIECLSPKNIVQTHDHEYLAVDFLMKIHSLFPSEKIVLSS
tara:strand:+ start:3044 stop:3715 length:672 start_codon:yes stop_codon:yes gene_type:complete